MFKRSLPIIIFAAIMLIACTSGKEKALELLRSGKEKMSNNDLKGALDDFSKAIEYNPALDQAWYHRANTKYNLNDKQGALEDYNECIRVSPDFAEAYANRASLKYEQGDHSGACADWKKAIQLGKENMSGLPINCP